MWLPYQSTREERSPTASRRRETWRSGAIPSVLDRTRPAWPLGAKGEILTGDRTTRTSSMGKCSLSSPAGKPVAPSAAATG